MYILREIMSWGTVLLPLWNQIRYWRTRRRRHKEILSTSASTLQRYSIYRDVFDWNLRSGTPDTQNMWQANSTYTEESCPNATCKIVLQSNGYAGKWTAAHCTWIADAPNMSRNLVPVRKGITSRLRHLSDALLSHPEHFPKENEKSAQQVVTPLSTMLRARN